MWIVFDQKYRNSYVFGAELFPRMRIPQTWYDAGIAVPVRRYSPNSGRLIGVPEAQFGATVSPVQRDVARRR